MDGTTLSSLLRQRLATSASVTLRAGGFSMLPAIAPGARLVLVALAPDDPRPGHVYLFEHVGGPRAHRFVGPAADGLRFRGDNARRDEVVPDRAALIGRVDALVVLGRRLPLTSRPARLIAALSQAAQAAARRLFPRAVRHRLGAALRRLVE